MLRLAIQKSGRLSEDSLQLIRECGISFNRSDNKLTSKAFNYPVEFLFLRDDDIPGYVADGVADIGIVGLNVLQEKSPNADIAIRLGFSKCRLSLAAPKDKIAEIQSSSLQSWLNGKSIATSYPNILNTYLAANQIKASVHEISGSVEIAPNIGLTDAICDLVSSGSTLLSNGLVEVGSILESEAVLISQPKLSVSQKDTLNELIFRIKSVQRAQNTKYIMLNAPNAQIPNIIKLLPGVKSPSIVPLGQEGWSSVHSVIKENTFWEIIQKLKEAGAEGILVLPIEKIIE